MEHFLYLLTKASLFACLIVIVYIITYPDKRMNDQIDMF
jgi:hypothetical protein